MAHRYLSVVPGAAVTSALIDAALAEQEGIARFVEPRIADVDHRTEHAVGSEGLPHGSVGAPQPKIASSVDSGNSSTIVAVCGAPWTSSSVHVTSSPLVAPIWPGVNRSVDWTIDVGHHALCAGGPDRAGSGHGSVRDQRYCQHGRSDGE